MSELRSRAVRRVSSRLIAVTFVVAAVALAPRAAAAQPLPSGWATNDVGSPAVAGRASFASSTFTVDGAGSDVWGASDQFRFAYVQLAGDITVVARVASLESTHAWMKAGVMIRESLSRSSRHAFALVSSSKGIAFQRRANSGGASASTAVAGSGPVWLRLQRQGTSFVASRSANGTSWTQIGSATIAMAGSVYVGLAVTSHNPSELATATFTNVNVSGGSGGALPSGWTSGDIGSPAVAGAATYASSTFTVRGAGADIWNTSDQFRFAYRQVTGDVDVIARVATLSGPDRWSKAGVMVRASLNAGSAHASMFTSVTRGHAFQRRPGAGLSSLHTSGGSGTAPVWLKLERRGSAVTAFRSANGSAWTMIGSETLTLPSTFYVGLAVTSHDPSSAATATFTNVSVGAGTTTTPPTVSLTSPAAGATYTAPASITISANASDSGGSINRVEFFAGSSLVGTDTSSPYSVVWTNVPDGSYSLTAVAYDNAGASTTSAARSVIVNNPAPPSRAIFGPSADHATVTRYVLDIFTAGANPNSAAPMATQDLGKPSVVSGDCSVNIATTINGLPSGTYFATVVAVSPGGTSARARSADFVR